MGLTRVIDEIQELGRAVEAARPGDASLGFLGSRIQQAKERLTQAASVLGPLVPNAANPPSLEEKTAADLARRLESLHEIVEAKRSAPP